MQNLKRKTGKRIGHDYEATRVADCTFLLTLFSHHGTQFIHSLNGLHPNFSKAKKYPYAIWVLTFMSAYKHMQATALSSSPLSILIHEHPHTFSHICPMHRHCYVSNQKKKKKKAQARCLWDDLISNDIWKWPHCANKIKLRPCLFLVLEICWVIKTGSPY